MSIVVLYEYLREQRTTWAARVELQTDVYVFADTCSIFCKLPSPEDFIHINRNARQRTFGHVRPAKIQISLRIRAGWSESSLGAFWIAKDAKFLHADNEDSNQTARMRRLIWVFVGRTCQKVRFLTLRFDDLISFYQSKTTWNKVRYV